MKIDLLQQLHSLVDFLKNYVRSRTLTSQHFCYSNFMSKRLTIKLITVWIVLWLPLSGALASTMQIFAAFNGVASSAFENHNENKSEGAMAFLPCHQSNSDNEDVADIEAAEPKKASCSHCTLCHIVGSIIPTAIPVNHHTIHHDCPQSIDAVSFTSFIPELPMRPPSLSRAT